MHPRHFLPLAAVAAFTWLAAPAAAADFGIRFSLNTDSHRGRCASDYRTRRTYYTTRSYPRTYYSSHRQPVRRYDTYREPTRRIHHRRTVTRYHEPVRTHHRRTVVRHSQPSRVVVYTPPTRSYRTYRSTCDTPRYTHRQTTRTYRTYVAPRSSHRGHYRSYAARHYAQPRYGSHGRTGVRFYYRD